MDLKISRKILAIITAFIAIFLFPLNGFAEEGMVDWPTTQLSVPKDKVWKVTFNTDVSKQDLQESIHILDDEGKQVSGVRVSKVSNRIVEVLPPTDGYDPGGKYELYITKETDFTNDNDLKSPVSMVFKIEQPEMVDVELKKEPLVAEDTINGNTVSQNALPSKSEVGDLIKLPPTDEHPDGRIRKVVEVDGDTVTLDKPETEEVFTRLRINKSVEIDEGDWEKVPDGVTISSVPSADTVQLYGVSGKYKGGILIEFDDYEIETDYLPLILNGSILYKTPTVNLDVEMGTFKMNHFNASFTSETEESLKVSVKEEGDFSESISIKDLYDELKENGFEGEVDLGKLKAPIGTTGAFAEVDLGVFLEGKYKGEIFTQLDRSSQLTIGAMVDRTEVRPVFNYEDELGFTVGGLGETEFRTGVFLAFNLTYMDLVTGGLDNKLGMYTEMKVRAEAGLEVDGTAVKNACYKFEPGTFFQSNVTADLAGITLLDVPVLGGDKKPLKKPFDSFVHDTCNQLDELITEQEVVLTGDKQVPLNVVAKYADFYEGTSDEKSIDFEDIDVTISDENLLTVSEDGMVQATPSATGEDQASIHLSYQGVEKTVTVSFTEVKQGSGLSEQQMIDKFNYLFDQITDTFTGDIKTHGENRDYSRIEEKINSYATDRLSTEIEEAFNDACYQCPWGSIYFGIGDIYWEVYTKVIEDKSNQIVIESFSAGGGYLVRGTLNKEGDQWKLEGIDFLTMDEQNNLDLSVEQAMKMDKYIHFREFEEHIDTYEVWVEDSSGVEFKTTVYVFSIEGSNYEMAVNSSTGVAYLTVNSSIME